MNTCAHLTEIMKYSKKLKQMDDAAVPHITFNWCHFKITAHVSFCQIPPPSSLPFLSSPPLLISQGGAKTRGRGRKERNRGCSNWEMKKKRMDMICILAHEQQQFWGPNLNHNVILFQPFSWCQITENRYRLQIKVSAGFKVNENPPGFSQVLSLHLWNQTSSRQNLGIFIRISQGASIPMSLSVFL